MSHDLLLRFWYTIITMSDQRYSISIPTPALITRIARLLATHKARVYVVGGVVRDAVINKIHHTNYSLRDFDIEVFGCEPKQLGQILKDNLPYYVSSEGKAFQVFKIHYQKGFKPIDVSVARSELSTGPSHKDFAIIADPNLSIAMAAQRRDLTMNALYYDPLNKSVIDPYGGYQHIKENIITHVNDSSFPEDPLRVLRIMQFAARFNFSVSPHTINLCTKMVRSGMLTTLPGERVTAEFLTFLYESTHPSRGLHFLHTCGALEMYLPELASLVKVDQTPAWHPEGSVYNHALQSANTAALIAQREGLSRFEKALLIVASICHDLGKAKTTTYVADRDVYTAYGHSQSGEELSKALLTRLNFPTYMSEIVPWLVQKHLLLPVLFENHRNGTDQTRAIHRLMRQLNEHNSSIEMLLWLTEADIRARNKTTDDTFEPLTAENIPTIQEMTDWVKQTVTEIRSVGEKDTEIVSGDQILSVINKSHGVWVRAIKVLIEDAVFNPDIREFIPRPFIFDEENKIQPAFINHVYESAKKFIDSHHSSWEILAQDDIAQLEVVKKVTAKMMRTLP